jgi:hypothetical protein
MKQRTIKTVWVILSALMVASMLMFTVSFGR